MSMVASNVDRPVLAPAPPSSRWLTIFVLCMLCLLVRGQDLLALPLFGDEAIYLRWAGLIREGHWWVSLADPKPPLHFWLMAVVLDWTADPLKAARLVSVAAGILSIPAVAFVCDELGALVARGTGEGRLPAAPTGRILGIVSAVLMLFCPFLAFYQRLATAESLFILEMLLAVGLALRWGRQIAEGVRAWRTAAALGVVLGLAMLTRQGFSYVLWGMLPAGLLLHWRRSCSRHQGWRAAGQFLLAAVIAGAMWTPYLAADFGRYAADRGGTAGELRTRILYQDQFSGGGESRAAVAGRNFVATFIPTRDADGMPKTGWFFFYMTGPLYIACLLGFVYLAVRRQWRVLLALGVWAALILGPAVALGTVLRSRYVVAGVLPLLIAGAYLLADVLAIGLSMRLKPMVSWSGAALVMIGLLVLPFRELGRQMTTWWTQRLTVSDRYQYVTGWTNGLAMRRAVDFIRNLAAGGPVVVITNDGWGLPADGAWVYLSKVPNVRLYYTSGGAGLLAPVEGAPETYMLREGKWLYTPARAVTLERLSGGEAVPVLYLTGDPVYTREGARAAEDYIPGLNANLKPVFTFDGIEENADHVALFELEPVPQGVTVSRG